MAQRTIGVLVMSYGTPASMDQIEAYYTHIRRGNPPSAEQLAELSARYEAIVGGFFPLRQNTDQQVQALQEELNRRTVGTETTYICYQGLKHASPFIEDGIQQMAREGIKEAVGIVLAPHYSVMSVGGYLKRAQEESDKQGVSFSGVTSYHLHPQLIEALGKRLSAKLDEFVLEGADRDQVHVLFSAHSLPVRILELDDPYPQQLLESSEAIAQFSQVSCSNWRFTWQSAGQTATPWLGPDIMDTLDTVHEAGIRYVISAPIGFVSDHLEVLYDLDIEAKSKSEQMDLGFKRIEMLNQDPNYMSVLADSIMSV